MTSDVEHFNALFVVSLESIPGQEHVCHLSKGKGSVRIQELDVSLLDVDIPFCKVGMTKDQEIDDIGEAQRYT